MPPLADQKPDLSVSHPMLTAIWQRGLPRLRDRLTQLERAAEAAEAYSLTAEDREAAMSTAHQLAGSLGMFGYANGTESARAIEALLESRETVDGAKLRQLTAALRSSLDLS